MRRSMHGAIVLAGLAFAACDVVELNVDTVYTHDGGVISGGDQWLQGTHVVNGDLTITSGVLEVAPCSTIQMAAGADISVQDGGALKLVGTADCPIKITSANGLGNPGDWGSIYLYASSDNANNVFDYVTIEYGGTDSFGVLWAESGTTFSMTNSTVQHNKSRGVELEDDVTLTRFSGNTLTDNGSTGIGLYANDVGQLGDGTYGPNTVEGVDVFGGTIDHTQTWPDLDTPYLVQDDIAVTGGVLQVAPCTTIEMPAGGDIDVRDGGALKLVGAVACSITITSSNATPTPGAWGTIDLYSSADNANNVFDYVTIEYGGTIDYGVLWAQSGAAFSMTNSIVRNNKSRGVELDDGVALGDFSGNTLTGNGTTGIGLYANDVGQLGEGTYGPNGVEGIEVFGGTVDHDQTWLDLGTRYFVRNEIAINGAGSALLTLSPGVTLAMDAGMGIMVQTRGAIHAVGSLAEPITFTSAMSTPMAGDWYEVDLNWDSMPSQFDYAVFEYGGSRNDWGMLWVDDGAEASVTNSTFEYGAAYGVDVNQTGVLTAFANNILKYNALGPVRVYPNGIGMLDAGEYWPNDVDAITVRAGDVTTGATWHNLDVPYTFDGIVSIVGDTGSALVAVDAGTVIQMAPGGAITVDANGGLALNGTIADHVVITSEKPLPSAGDWAEIDISYGSVGAYNSFTYTDISWGGSINYGQIWLDIGAGLALDNVTFTGSGCGCDIYFDVGNYEPAAFSRTNTDYSMCIH